MADEMKVEEKVDNAVELVTEAARLHLILGKASTRDTIVAALAWRYGDCGGAWVRVKIYEKALILVNMMPARQQ